MDDDTAIMWYYAEGSRQQGPFDAKTFLDLVRRGAVTSDTLVWRSGMAGWEPYGKLAAEGAPRSTESACHYCGKSFPDAELLDFKGTRVCAACKPVFVQQFKENAEISPALGRRYAGFWIRFIAKILDGVLCGILTQSVMFFSMFATGSRSADNPTRMFSVLGISYVLCFAISILYSVLPLVKYGATPGKMALGLKVIRSDGEPLTYGRAVGRFFGEFLSGMILNIGYLIAAFDKEEHKALHDIICDTRVVYKNARS